MPRQRRSSLDAPFFHVINRSVRKAPIFRRPPDYRAFLGVLQEGLDRFPVRLVAFCLLSNHWHLVLEPAGTEGMIRFMHWVTTTHAARWHKHRESRGQGPVYQGRYHSVPIDGTGDLIRACRYVERNALRAGLVRRAQDWPWCSLAERLRTSPEVTLKPARFFTSQAWIEHVNTAGTLREQIEEPLEVVTMDPMRRRRRPRHTPGTKQAKGVEKRYDPLRDVAEIPGAGAERGQDGGHGRRRAHQDQPHAHVERAEHLRLRHPARALQPLEQRRNRPALPVK